MNIAYQNILGAPFALTITLPHKNQMLLPSGERKTQGIPHASNLGKPLEEAGGSFVVTLTYLSGALATGFPKNSYFLTECS